MSILAVEYRSKHRAESAAENLIRRQLELAKAAIPYMVNEATDAPFLDVENTLSQLTLQAEEMIEERGKPSRKIRRSLSQYAHRLLEITDSEPDLLDQYSISLVAHASDATGERELLETTLEQAYRADMTSDTNLNLRAIEAALKRDVPFTEVMTELNKIAVPFVDEDEASRTPLPRDYDYLFSSDAAYERRVPLLDEEGHEISTIRPLFRK